MSNKSEEESKALEELSNGNLEAALPLIENYAIPLVSGLLILFIGYFVSKFISRIAGAPLRKRVDETLGRFVSKLVFYSLMTFTVLGVLGKFGVSVASFAAVVAAAGFAIGMAFQGTLSNFAAGVLLLVFRPFKVGDFVSAAGISATVYEIDLFTTTFDSLDNRRIIVPNSTILDGTIENVTHHTERRVDVCVGADYSADIEATRTALTSAANALEKYLIQAESRGFQVVLLNLGDSSVNWEVRFWTKATNYWQVKEELTASIKNELDSAGIGIPFPQLDVHLSKPLLNS